MHGLISFPSSVRPAYRRGALAVMLAALLLASGLVTLDGFHHTAWAQTQNPDDVLYVTLGGVTTGDCKRQHVFASPPSVPEHYDYTAACTLEYALEQASEDENNPDALWIAEGDYSPGVVITKPVTLVGGFIDGFVYTDTVDDPVAYPVTTTTRILGAGNLPAITIEAPVTTTVTRTVTLDGLYISPDVGNSGPGISVTWPISPDVGVLVTDTLYVDLDVLQSYVEDNVNTGDRRRAGHRPAHRGPCGRHRHDL